MDIFYDGSDIGYLILTSFAGSFFLMANSLSEESILVVVVFTVKPFNFAAIKFCVFRGTQFHYY